jgi:3-(3-hydroxy-phenyl)propionate hydroxylase
MHTPPGRRYLTEMRYRPDTRVRSGAVVRLEGPHQSLIGTPLRQPRVLRAPRHEVTRLDDVLGRGWSLLGIGVTEADWATATARTGLPDATRVDVCLDDRAPRDHVGRTGIADADGRLDALFAQLTGHFVLVRPDKLVAAVFTPDRAGRVAAELRQSTGSAGDDTSAEPVSLSSRPEPQVQPHVQGVHP